MNDLEFQTQYKRLKDVHPMYFNSQEKMTTVWNAVNDLDVEWFTKLVDRIVSANDIRFEKYNIHEAAIGERRSRRSIKFAEDLCEVTKGWERLIDQGLDKILEKYEAENLLEAVEKSRRGIG